MTGVSRFCVILVIVSVLCSSRWCHADWGEAESEDFVLDTTVPEPALVAMGAVGVALLAARRRRRTFTCAMVGAVLAAGTSRGGRVLVTNVVVEQRPEEAMVDVWYDLVNARGGSHHVVVEVSTNAGLSYLGGLGHFSGAVGDGVETGVQRHVVWNAGADLPGVSGVYARVRVRASDDPTEYLVIDVSAGPGATHYPYYYLRFPPAQDEVHRSSKILLRKVPAGTFLMGSAPSDPYGHYDEPEHVVTLTQAFYVGVYEITQGQFSNVMGVNPAYFTNGAYGAMRPVEMVSWEQVRGGTWPGGLPASNSFVGRLAQKTGLKCDLPTEAEWEYACRAGTTNALNSDTNLSNEYQDAALDVLGRYFFNGGNAVSNDPINGAHALVGSYLPNRWGLYDMHGNVQEWCLDWYDMDYYYSAGVSTNPVGPVSGTERVVRGGGWGSTARDCRSANRRRHVPSDAGNSIGFRLVVRLEE